MDLYDKGRTLVYSGPLSRRNRPEGSVASSWSSTGWTDLSAALLDNYCMGSSRAISVVCVTDALSQVLLTREEQRPNGVVKRHLMSRVRLNGYA